MEEAISELCQLAKGLVGLGDILDRDCVTDIRIVLGMFGEHRTHRPVLPGQSGT